MLRFVGTSSGSHPDTGPEKSGSRQRISMQPDSVFGVGLFFVPPLNPQARGGFPSCLFPARQRDRLLSAALGAEADADLARLFGEYLGVEVVIQEIDWDNKILELDGLSIDCVWNGMTLTVCSVRFRGQRGRPLTPAGAYLVGLLPGSWLTLPPLGRC